ncbi:MAG: dihydrodipicolinate synthase family protein [Candidatus Saccharibacteria bacterium]|nr:dihydrodipicolinate synthase family protein [Pseudorhodobacter sp.]
MHRRIRGTYPMLYAFFGPDGSVQRAAFARQIDAAVAVGASGVAVLGLGTEVGKLSRAEQRQIVEWVAQDLNGRLPLAVTVADGNTADMIASARFAFDTGADWLILQPPRPPISGAQLVAYFGTVAAAVDGPIAIQNAPDFLGVGLTAAELLALNAAHPNVCVVKAESSAVGVANLIDKVGSAMTVFNGRAGLELTDNYRAGVSGMIPGMDTIDLQVAVEKAMRAGDEAAAEALYQRMLPAVTYAMQGLAHLVLYGKYIAALRLGLLPSHARLPADLPTPLGLQWAQRMADALGPLP